MFSISRLINDSGLDRDIAPVNNAGFVNGTVRYKTIIAMIAKTKYKRVFIGNLLS